MAGQASEFLSRIRERAFDFRYGIQSRKCFQLNDLGIEDPDAHYYAPVPYAACRPMVKALGPGPSRTMLDAGSGLGRPLAVALGEGFGKAIGVEFSGELCQIARSNLARYGDRVEIVEQDIRRYEVPDRVSAIFFGNAFWGETLEMFLDSIRRSLIRSPREMPIAVFNHRRFSEATQNSGWIQLREQHTLFTPDPASWALYRATAS